MKFRRIGAAVGSWLIASAVSGATSAQENFPNRTVRVVNPTPWFGIAVPAGTPQPVVARISEALEAGIAAAEVRDRLDIAGCTAKSARLAEFADIIKSEIALWAKVVREGRHSHRLIRLHVATTGQCQAIAVLRVSGAWRSSPQT